MPERRRRPEPDQDRPQRPIPGPDEDQFDPLEDIDDIIDEEQENIGKEEEDRQ